MTHTKQMKDFIKELLENFYPDCADIDGGDFQDIAEKHGILIQTIRHEPCGEPCVCNEMCSDEEWKEGVSCYKAADWLYDDERKLHSLINDDFDLFTNGNCPKCKNPLMAYRHDCVRVGEVIWHTRCALEEYYRIMYEMILENKLDR